MSGCKGCGGSGALRMSPVDPVHGTFLLRYKNGDLSRASTQAEADDAVAMYGAEILEGPGTSVKKSRSQRAAQAVEVPEEEVTEEEVLADDAPPSEEEAPTDEAEAPNE